MREGRLNCPLLTRISANSCGDTATIVGLLDAVGAALINKNLSFDLDVACEQGNFDTKSWSFFLG